MIIIEEQDSPIVSGERSPLKSPASYPNVILSPAARPQEVAPPPPYGSTSAATARVALSPTTERDRYPYSGPYQNLQKFLAPEPYTRRTLGRFLYALFVAVLINRIWVTGGNTEEVTSQIDKIFLGRDPAATERRLPIQYPPKRIKYAEVTSEKAGEVADVDLDVDVGTAALS
ncbi:hypothetical protein BDQ17DRAFT_721472 [Cyathus striatus]|nr:hypothetical protein BDQ17DRAFT_721472 [Cyathus striatus]